MPREIYASFFFQREGGGRGGGGGNKADYVEMLNDKNFIDFFYVSNVTVSEISPNTGIAFLCRASFFFCSCCLPSFELT